VAVPYLCIAIADLASAAWRAAGERPKQLALRAVVAGFAALFLLEGLAVAAKDLRDARDAPGYEAVGARIAEVVPEGSVVIGDNRLWPALEEQGLRLRSLLLLFYHTNPRISEGRATDIPGAFERIDADYLLLSPLSREILNQLSPDDTRDFDAYLRHNFTLVDTLDYPVYGPIEVFRAD
jgi:hypothetical protein